MLNIDERAGAKPVLKLEQVRIASAIPALTPSASFAGSAGLWSMRVMLMRFCERCCPRCQGGNQA
jgi:hypothetical protein